MGSGLGVTKRSKGGPARRNPARATMQAAAGGSGTRRYPAPRKRADEHMKSLFQESGDQWPPAPLTKPNLADLSEVRLAGHKLRTHQVMPPAELSQSSPS